VTLEAGELDDVGQLALDLADQRLQQRKFFGATVT